VRALMLKAQQWTQQKGIGAIAYTVAMHRTILLYREALSKD